MGEQQSEGDIGDQAKELYTTHERLEGNRSKADAEKAETDAVYASVHNNPDWYIRSRSVKANTNAREANNAADAHLWRAEQHKNEHLDEYIAEAKTDDNVDGPEITQET